ncbi:MAG: polyphosphate kinase 2 family protein [Phycisphaerales bacterium]|nr:polyphosphate kinase 2 family protein [Planctomycetota bacterium]
MPHNVQKLISPYRVTKGKKFRLKDIDPSDTGPLKSKEEAKEMLERGIGWLAEEQEKLYASDSWSLLLVFQAMDAAGKDGTIKHVMSGVNPQGCEVHSFKAPSSDDLDHDYMWRCARRMPERGRIGIFNRSYYEEVLVVRVHPEYLMKQRLPQQKLGKDLWDERFEDIRNFEKYHTRQGTVIRKFFLHVSRNEQRRRFLERLQQKDKHWKFSASDIAERAHWDKYMEAYEDMICNTATEDAPWFVVPADNKWFTRVVVAAAIVDAVHSLKLEFPKVDKRKMKELEAIEATLRGRK